MFTLILPPFGHGFIVFVSGMYYMWVQRPLIRNAYLLWAVLMAQGTALLYTVFYDGTFSLLTHGLFFMTTLVTWLAGITLGAYVWKKPRTQHSE